MQMENSNEKKKTIQKYVEHLRVIVLCEIRRMMIGLHILISAIQQRLALSILPFGKLRSIRMLLSKSFHVFFFVF